MNVTLRFNGRQHAELQNHLFRDGNEAAAVVLCGRRERAGAPILTAHRIFPIPDEACSVRRPDRLLWHTDAIEPALELAMKEQCSVVKVHSHPGGYESFSLADDEADRQLFPSLHGWIDVPHVSAVMIPEGRIFGRHVDARGHFTPLERVAVAGEDLFFWDSEEPGGTIPQSADRHARAFGAVTTRKLGTLSAALIGCSGTGSIMAEQLGRLGLKRLVLIDPQRAEDVNLNRIFGLTAKDVAQRRYKVEVLKRVIESMGLGTEVIALPLDLASPDAISAVAECDLIFGGMDSASGRHIANKLSCTYNLPYFDAGVKLMADGIGNIHHVCGSVHYLQPGGSSLLSRRVYTMGDVETELLMKTDPDVYSERLKEKYIKGVEETRPAVVSVNTVYAGLTVTEMLARLHPFRDDPNDKFASLCLSLNHGILDLENDGSPCPVMNRFAGRGDMSPLLGMQGLEGRSQ